MPAAVVGSRNTNARVTLNGLASGHFSVIDADLWEMGKAAAALCRTPALRLRFCESSEFIAYRTAKNT
jgi:hypothetical protein